MHGLDISKLIITTRRQVVGCSLYHIPARVERRGDNVMSWDGKLQQLVLVSFDDLVMLTVNVRTESAVKT